MTGYLWAIVIGITLGLFGGGGSILTVPVFVYVMGYDPKLAIAMSFPVVGLTSIVGAIGHWRAGNVRPSATLLFGIVAMTGAFIGARASYLLDGRVQIAILGVAMAAAAAMMLRSSRGGAAEPSAPKPPSFMLYVIAFAVGALTGTIGIGGGFLIVPALVIFGHEPMRQAVGTSLVVIAMNSISGYAGQRVQQPVPWTVVLIFTALATLAILGATRFAGRVPQRSLKRGFAVLLFVIALLVLWQNRSLLRQAQPLRNHFASMS
jgi:hypothetical protein